LLSYKSGAGKHYIKVTELKGKNNKLRGVTGKMAFTKKKLHSQQNTRTGLYERQMTKRL